jgi:WD40 repeat protein
MGCSNAKGGSKYGSAGKNIKVFCSTGNETPLGSFYEFSDEKIILGTISGAIMVYTFDNTKFHLCFIKEKAHESNVVSFTEIPNHILISVSTDTTAKLWEVKDNDLHLLHTITDHTKIISKVITLKTFNHFLSCSIDSTMRVYSTSQPYEAVKTLYEENSLMTVIQLSKDNKDKIVCTGAKFENGDKPFISIWNVSTYEKEHMFQGNEQFMPIFLLELPNGNVAISTKTSVVVVNPKTYQMVCEINDPKTENEMPTGICLFEGDYIVYICNGRVVKVGLGSYQIKAISMKSFDKASTIYSIRKGEFFIVNKGKGMMVMNYIEED